MDFIEQELLKLLVTQGKIKDVSKCKREIANIKTFCKIKLDGVFEPEADVGTKKSYFDYDIVSWIDSDFENNFSNHESENKIQYNFSFTKAKKIQENIYSLSMEKY